jgi:DivIVA domain-containing protein
MALNADDIEDQEFSKARKGYDRDEVDRFQARVAKRVRKLEKRLAKAEADSSDGSDSTELTRHIGEILMLAGEQAKRATEEAETAAAAIIATARAEADAAIAEADAARQVALDAIESARMRVAETIETELGLHDELEAAATTIRSGGVSGPTPEGSSEDPLAQVVRDAVDRASDPQR